MGRRRGWRQRFGAAAEEHATRYLQAHGVRVLARNHRCRRGEIDIVGLDGDVLVFFEVKARAAGSLAFGTPGEAVGARKQRRLIAAARDYLDRYAAGRGGIRFDVLELRSRAGRIDVTWLADAFRP